MLTISLVFAHFMSLISESVLMQILGIPVIRVAGVEADDVIGTVAKRAAEDGLLVAIASPDKARHMAPLSLHLPCPLRMQHTVPDRKDMSRHFH